MAKQELKWMPLLGQYCELRRPSPGTKLIPVTASGAVWVNRKDRKDAMRSMKQAGEDMKKNGVSYIQHVEDQADDRSHYGYSQRVHVH